VLGLMTSQVMGIACSSVKNPKDPFGNG